MGSGTVNRRNAGIPYIAIDLKSFYASVGAWLVGSTVDPASGGVPMRSPHR